MHSPTWLFAAVGGVNEKAFSASASGVLFLAGRTRDKITRSVTRDDEELLPIDAGWVAVVRIDNHRGRILWGQRFFRFSLETISSLVVGFAFLFHFSVSLRERVLIFSDGHSP